MAVSFHRVRMGRLQEIAGERRIGSFRGPAERQQAIIFYRRIAPDKARRKVSVGILHQLLKNLHLVLSRDRMPGLVEIVRLVVLQTLSGVVLIAIEELGRQRLLFFIHDNAQLVGATRRPDDFSALAVRCLELDKGPAKSNAARKPMPGVVSHLHVRDQLAILDPDRRHRYRGG